ncbi:MAG TPA: GAF domain-containing SpoIIE family protein phosphatase [Spirochaetia bacterium]|nr:GAF domain-containing SpoIIE family protein phosphatase [Spirochaetia bacterium]
MNFTILWAKLFVSLSLIAVLAATSRGRKLPGTQLLLALFFLLCARDVAFSLFPHPLLIPLSDIAVLALILVWSRVATERWPADSIFLGLNAFFLLAGVFLAIVPIFRLSPFAVGLLLFADVIYLAIVLGLVSAYTARNVSLVSRPRFLLVSALFVSHVITLLYGYNYPWVHLVILPPVYMSFLAILLTRERFAREEAERSIQFFSSSLDSTYDFMENLGGAITAKIDLPRVMEIIIDSAVRSVGADSGAILMIDEYQDVLRVRATYGVYPPLLEVPDIVKVKASSLKQFFSDTPIPVGETVLGESVKTGLAIMIRDCREDPRMEQNSKDDILFVSSLLAIPLVVGDRVLGVISALKRAANQHFTDEDFQHLKTFADYASITIDNLYTYVEVLEKRQMEREVDIAAQIQKRLLPSQLPNLSNAILAVHSVPARGVSGDYYDVIRLDENKVALVICDVAGKGIPAAMVMVMIRSIVHLLAGPGRDAAATLTDINQGITGRIEIDHFATIGVLIYDQGQREVQYANAAHLPLMVYRRRTGTLAKLDAKGLPIGVERDACYEQKRIRVEPGDLLVLCTDGIIEAMNSSGKQYTLARLKGVIEKGAADGADKLVDSIREDVTRHVGAARQHDDQTLLLLQVR